VQRYLPGLLDLIDSGKFDPSFVITHELPLTSAPDAYEVFKHKKDGCIKVVLKPFASETPGKMRTFAVENDPMPAGESLSRVPVAV
jgi:hypothetical protein